MDRKNILEQLEVIKKRPFLYVENVEHLKSFLFGFEAGFYGLKSGLSEVDIFIKDVEPDFDKDLKWAEELINIYLKMFTGSLANEKV